MVSARKTSNQEPFGRSEFNLKLQNTSFDNVSNLDQTFTGNYSSETKQILLRHPQLSTLQQTLLIIWKLISTYFT